jgi:hypothetical protein
MPGSIRPYRGFAGGDACVVATRLEVAELTVQQSGHLRIGVHDVGGAEHLDGGVEAGGGAVFGRGALGGVPGAGDEGVVVDGGVPGMDEHAWASGQSALR